jgi:MFS family permease
MAAAATATDRFRPDGPYAWWRLLVSICVAAVGGVGMWSTIVVLPYIETDFGLDRGGSSLPYTLSMIGFALGGMVMGRLVDRFGVAVPVALGAVMLCIGYVASAFVTAYWQFLAVQAVVIGFLGSSVSFGPVVADVSLWFRKRRGIAVALAASGNYLAGMIWSPLIQAAVAEVGWRQTHIGIGIICVVLMIPAALLLRRRPDLSEDDLPAPGATPAPPGQVAQVPLSPRTLQLLLMVAGISCCVAMAMPQVHIVAYCVDLGFGPARGAEMLSVMLGLGIVSRLVSGVIADKIGGLRTLILGSGLQMLALTLYLPFDGLMPLFIVSAIFGLSQGGIVPSYALIVREYFPAREAGARVSFTLMVTVLGMALGGWLSGEIYDLTGSYQAAFLNGIAWNFLNLMIAIWLLTASRPKRDPGARRGRRSGVAPA